MNIFYEMFLNEDNIIGKTRRCLDKGEWNGTKPKCISSVYTGIKSQDSNRMGGIEDLRHYNNERH